MVNKFAKWLVKDLARCNNYDEAQQEQMLYILRILMYELIKLIIILILFSCFGYFKESILIMIFMMTTKPFTGGYHEDSQVRCFLATIIIITLIIILSKTTSLNVINSIILNFISIFCIYNQAPVINEKMPLTKEELIRKNKIIGVINSSIFLILSIILFNIRWFSQIIVWTSVVQTMLLFNKYKKIHGGR